jgi:hypothetical protein
MFDSKNGDIKKASDPAPEPKAMLDLDPTAPLSNFARNTLQDLWIQGLGSGTSSIPSFAALKSEARNRAEL